MLVGHSLAGVTIPEVARRAPARVAHLVFVSAAVPAEGTSVAEMRGVDAPERAEIDQRDPSERPTLSEELVRAMFGTDLDDEAMRLVLDNFGGEVMGVMTERVSRVGVPADVGKTWVRLLRDVAVPVAMQDGSIRSLQESPGGAVDVVDLDTGHTAMLSRPRELAATIDAIASPAI